MDPVRSDLADRPGNLGSRELGRQDLRLIAPRLHFHVSQITPEELERQDATYDRDSALGRELLFLIADTGWLRATSEAIDIPRSDTVDTTIKIDTDLGRITHEALRGRTGQLWLPVLVLPPLLRSSLVQAPRDLRSPDPHPFSNLAVSDADGLPVAMLPSADVRHRIAAALTEIIVKVDAWMPDAGGLGFTANRDHRLLLSAAIYRLLRNEHVPSPVLGRGRLRREPASGDQSRIARARHQLRNVLAHYSNLLTEATGQIERERRRPAEEVSLARRIAERALLVLRALAESTIVVVTADQGVPGRALMVTVPGRALHIAPSRRTELTGPVSESARRWARLGSWRRWHPENWILPRASLQIDLLLPNSDADRQVQVKLPDGTSLDPSLPRAARAALEIRTEESPPASELIALTTRLVDSDASWPPQFGRALADLASAKADTVWESLRDNRAGVARGEQSATEEQTHAATTDFRKRLHWLSGMLRDISAHGLTRMLRAELRRGWRADGDAADGTWLRTPLLRRTAVDIIGPDTVVARAQMIEEPAQRAAPIEARIGAHVAVTDSEYFTTAQLSGWLSCLLMVIVLGLFLLGNGLGIVGRASANVSPEVLVLVLTLFSAIQIGRVERPDRSTLRGLLARTGNRLILISILPTVILAVALGISRGAIWVISWATGCIAGQVVLQWLAESLRRQALARGRLSDGEYQSRAWLVFYTDPPDYSLTGSEPALAGGRSPSRSSGRSRKPPGAPRLTSR